MHDLAADARFRMFMEAWSDPLGGSTGLYRLVIALAVKLEKVVDWEQLGAEQQLGFYDVSIAIANALITKALADEAPPEYAEMDALIAAAMVRQYRFRCARRAGAREARRVHGVLDRPDRMHRGLWRDDLHVQHFNHDCDTFKAEASNEQASNRRQV